ncbi:MAG: hypothetical protein IKE94_12935 [Aeriscardovia sp.]|nr:hypothetical protein [Aeriscardovia sp.]
MKGLGLDYQRAEASTTTDFVRLPAGGYVCRIISATDHPDEEKPYLDIVYDIAEGEHAGYYSDEWGRTNTWAHSVRWYYTKNALGVFKGNMKSVDESNGTSFEASALTGIDERKLAGCLVGMIIGEEEYEGNDGSVKTRLRARSTRPAAQIREGRFKQPELKKIANEEPVYVPPTPTGEDDLPF